MHAQELAQQESDEPFRILVEAVQDYAILMLDPAGNVMTWNAGAERIKGYDVEEIIGKHFSCFYMEKDRQQGTPLKGLELAAKAGRCEAEGWRVRKDGSKFWANVVITAMRDHSGQLFGFAKITRDWTERKQAEDKLRASHDELERRVRDRTADLNRVNEELQASEERFRLMIEGVKDYAIYMLDPEGRVASWNEGAARIYGYTAEEVVGHPRSRFFPPEDVANGLPTSELQEAVAKGRRLEEAWRVRKDGSRFWANGTISPLRNTAGELRGFVIIVRDLTERKQIETELRKVMEVLQLRDRAIQAVSQGILITDPHQPDDPIIYASPGVERLTGYPPDEVVGRNCRFLQGKDTDPKAVAQVRSALREGEPCEVELLNYRKDGTPFWNHLLISPVRDEAGRLTHFIGVQTDVTGRRRLEIQFRQAQKMEAVGRLAGGVAHDFNNLLTIINGYTDLLLQRLQRDDPMRELLAEVHKAGERAGMLTRQLLVFSRQSVLENESP